MKTLKFKFAIFALVFIFCNHKAIGQTYQVYPSIIVTNGPAWCLNRPVSGSIVYHLTYHVDKKTGFVDRVHANIHSAEITDDETGERYITIDTGNDNLGISWGFWNDPENNNPGFDYDKPSYNLPVGALPTDGCSVFATFKFIAKGGEKYTMHSVTHITINANGEATADFYKDNVDCNE